MGNRTNDWFAANLNAPEGTTLLDMYASGITPDNTAINTRDYYKNIPQVQQAFMNDNGSFDEKTYNAYYDSAVRSFNDYADKDFIEKTISNMSRSPYDWMNLENPNILDTSAYITNIKDKNRSTIGTGNIWQTGDPVYSDREVAQANYVRDEAGNMLDWTANDKGGVFKSLFRPTLALATYNEDGTHFENGIEVEHHKGDLKLDWKGDPYTEMLGDKEYYGKDIVKWSDTLTKEDSWINKFDPFDSDGLTKSIGATIAETAVKIAPFLIPGVGPYLGYAIAAKELASVFPTFLKGINGLFGGDNENMFGKTMNQWESYMERYSDSMSDRGKGSFWNFENIGNVISSSFGQLTSQRAIANIPKILADKSIRTSKVGQQLALSYMAITSSKDAYSTFKEAGAEDWLAGAGMLGTMGVYYGLMNINYFKDWIFRDSWLGEDIEFRRSLKEFIKQTAEQLKLTPNNTIKSPLLKKMLANKVMNQIYTKGGELLKKFSKTGFAQGIAHSGLNEGIEEVTEEAASDLVKSAALALEALGVKVTEDPLQKLDFGFSPEDILQRYAASFVGGFIGGTMFKGYEWYDNYQKGEKSIHNIEDLNKRIAWYSRNGYHDKAIQLLETWRKKGKLPADLNKSAIQFAEVENIEDSKVDLTKKAFLSTNNDKESQHEYLYNIIKDKLVSVHEALSENLGSILLSDEDLQKKVRTRIENKANAAKLTVDEYQKKELIDEEIEVLDEIGFFNLAVADADELSNKVYLADFELKKANAKLAKTESESEQKIIKKEIASIEKVLKAYRDEWEEIINGERAANYVAKAYYRTNNPLLKLYLESGDLSSESTFFPETDIHHYTKLRYGLNYDSLGDTAKALLTSEFNAFQEKSIDSWEQRLRTMMDLQYVLSKNHAKTLQRVSDEMSGYRVGNNFTNKYAVNYWNELYDYIDKQNAEYETIPFKIEAYKPFEKKTVQTLSDEDKQTLLELSGNTLNLDNIRDIHVYLSALQRQLHILENFDAYIDVTTRMKTEKLSIDQMMTEEGIVKWGNVLAVDSSDSDASRDMQLQMVKNFYIKLKEDKIISPSEGMLYRFVMGRNFDIARPVIEGWINDNFNSTPDEESGKLIRNGSSFVEDFDIALYYPEDSSYDNYIIPGFKNKLDAIKDALISGSSEKVNIAIESFKTFVTSKDAYYEEEPEDYENEAFEEWLESFDVDKFMTRMLNPINNLIAFNKEMEPVLKLVEESPIIDFLSELSLDVNGKPLKILEVITDTENAIKLVDRVENLEISSQTLKELHDAKHLLNIAKALFITAYKDPMVGGLSINDKINTFGESFASTDNFLLGQELDRIGNRLQTIIDLIEQNVVSTTEEQKRIAINVFPKLIKSLVNPSVDDKDFKSFTKTLNEIFDVKENILYDLWIKAEGLDLNTITGENYKTFEQVTRKWMSLVREELTPKLITKYAVKEGSNITVWENIGNVIGEKFGKSLGDMQSTKLSSQTKFVTMYDSLNLLLAILGSDTNDFYSKIKTVFESESKNDKAFLPYFGQELNILISWARRKNNALFNGFNDKLTKTDNPNKKGDEFIKGIKALSNFVMIDGSSGTGKSTGYSYYLNKLLLMDGDITISSSKIQERHENLGKLLGSKSISVDTILEILTSKKDIYRLDGSHVVFKKDYELPEKMPNALKAIFGEDPSKTILFVDEITLLHAGELLLLTEFAKKFGITIVGLGDGKQPSAKFKNETAGLENFVYTKGPTLQASLRITNKAKRRNRNSIEGLLNDVLDAYAIHPYWNEKQINAEIKEIVNNNRTQNENDLYNLMYTFDGSGVYGEMFSETPETYIDRLLEIVKKNNQTITNDNEKQTLAIVYDENTKKKYSKWADSKEITMVDADKVQGGEYSFVVLDCDFNNTNKLELLRKFNMLTGRSKVGTIIGVSKTNDVRKQLVDGTTLFNSYEEESGKISLRDPNSEENKSLRKEFINWRMDLLDDVKTKDVKEISPVSPETKPVEKGKVGLPEKPNVKTIIPESEITKEEILETELNKDDSKLDPENDSENAPYTDRNNYPFYKKRQTIVNSKSDQISDGEEVFKLITSLTEEQLIGLIGNRYHFADENKHTSNINNLHRLFQIVSGYLLDEDKAITNSFETALRGLDPTMDHQLAIDILDELKKPSDKSFYRFSPSKEGSVISFCMLKNGNITAIPIAKIKQNVSGSFRTINASQQIGTMFVSSKGRKFSKISETIKDKFWYPEGKKLGIFAPIKEEILHKNLIPGKAYLPLLLPHQIARLGGIDNYFKTSKININGSYQTRLSADGEWKLKVPIPGVQKIITFDKAMEVWRKLNELNKVRIGDRANELKEELRPYFGNKIDEVKARTSDLDTAYQKGSAPKSLTSNANLGRLFTAVLRYFQNNPGENANHFYTELLKSNLSFNVVGKDLEYRLIRFAGGYEVFNLKTGVKEENIPLSASFDPLVILEKLNIDNGKELLENNLCTFTPGFVAKDGVFRVSYDYRVFSGTIKQDVSLWTEIDTFLAQDTYFNHNIYLSIYANTNETIGDEGIWKVGEFTSDEEFMWDIVETLLPVYSVHGKDSIDGKLSNNGINVNLVDQLLTPAKELDDTQPSISFKAGLSYKNDRGIYKLFIGNIPSGVTVNSKWLKENVNNFTGLANETFLIEQFDENSVWIREKGSLNKYIVNTNFKTLIENEGVLEETVVDKNSVQLNGETYEVSTIKGNEFEIKFGKYNCKLVSISQNILQLYHPLLNDGKIFSISNVLSLQPNELFEKLEFIGNTENYIFYKWKDSNDFEMIELGEDVSADKLVSVTPEWNIKNLTFLTDNGTRINDIPSEISDKIWSIFENGVVVEQDAKLVKVGKNKYDVFGFVIKSGWLNRFLQTSIKEDVEIKIKSIDFEQNTISGYFGNNLETFELQSNLSLETFGEEFVEKLDKDSLENPLLNDLKKTINTSFSEFNVESLSEDIDSAISEINEWLDNRKYKFGKKFEIYVDNNRIERKFSIPQELEIGSIVLKINPDFEKSSIFEISDIIRNDPYAKKGLKIKDFWVTLESGKFHYQLVAENKGWELREVSTEEMIETIEQTSDTEENIKGVIQSFESYVSSLGDKTTQKIEYIKNIPLARNILNSLAEKITNHEDYSSLNEPFWNLINSLDNSSDADIQAFANMFGSAFAALERIGMNSDSTDNCNT